MICVGQLFIVLFPLQEDQNRIRLFLLIEIFSWLKKSESKELGKYFPRLFIKNIALSVLKDWESCLPGGT